MSTIASPRSDLGHGSRSDRRERFRRWRQMRPFWGCAFGIFAGVEIYLVAAAPLKVMAMQGLPGLLTLFVALAAIVFSGVTLVQPHLRTLTGIVVLILGPVSILATNLGGFVMGMVLLIVGGAMILAWRPADSDANGERGPAVVDGAVAVVPVAGTVVDGAPTGPRRYSWQTDDAPAPQRRDRRFEPDSGAAAGTVPVAVSYPEPQGSDPGEMGS